MNLRGVAVLALNSHPYLNVGPSHAPCACQKTNRIRLQHQCLKVLIVPGNELRLFWAKVFSPTLTINVAQLT